MSSALVVVNVITNVSGTLLLKHVAVTASPIAGIGGVACYAVAASLFVAVAVEQPLSWLAVITSVLGLVAVTLIGAIVFNEPLTPLRYVGIAMALGAVVLMSVPASSP